MIALAEARHRYRNARRRALYISGLPSFSPYRSQNTNPRAGELYELAMCDCKNWGFEIERLGGKRPAHYDPKAAFAIKWQKMMLERAAP